MKTLFTLATILTLALVSCRPEETDQSRDAIIETPSTVTIKAIGFESAYQWNDTFNEPAGFEIRVNGQTRYVNGEVINFSHYLSPPFTMEREVIEVYLFDIDGASPQYWISRDTFTFDLVSPGDTILTDWRDGAACELHIDY